MSGVAARRGDHRTALHLWLLIVCIYTDVFVLCCYFLLLLTHSATVYQATRCDSNVRSSTFSRLTTAVCPSTHVWDTRRTSRHHSNGSIVGQYFDEPCNRGRRSSPRHPSTFLESRSLRSSTLNTALVRNRSTGSNCKTSQRDRAAAVANDSRTHRSKSKLYTAMMLNLRTLVSSAMK